MSLTIGTTDVSSVVPQTSSSSSSRDILQRVAVSCPAARPTFGNGVGSFAERCVLL